MTRPKLIKESISEERQLENLDRNEKRQDGKERHRPHGVALTKVPPDDVQKVRAKETPLPEAQIRQQLDEMQRQISYLKKVRYKQTMYYAYFHILKTLSTGIILSKMAKLDE